MRQEENYLSNAFLELLVEYAKNPPPDPNSPMFYDWQNEMKIHTDSAAISIIGCLDERYKIDDHNF